MVNEKQTSVSIKYIDATVYDELVKIAKAKHFTGKSKKDLINFTLNDYIHMHELDEFHNPYLIKNIQSIINAACASTEKNLGGRITKIMSENSINLGVLNRIVMEFLNKFGDNEETKIMLNSFRQEAIEDLRDGKPITYMRLLQNGSDE